jgi:hypothetical protein
MNDYHNPKPVHFDINCHLGNLCSHLCHEGRKTRPQSVLDTKTTVTSGQHGEKPLLTAMVEHVRKSLGTGQGQKQRCSGTWNLCQSEN